MDYEPVVRLDLKNLMGEVVSSGSDNKITIFRIEKGKKQGKEGCLQKINFIVMIINHLRKMTPLRPRYFKNKIKMEVIPDCIQLFG
ncbi:MAG: hypothetical protein BGO55_18810 [Sphingobacteriales bacterium 50-39]|nr:MAG: hypothetical protein BGO55_18810 [Sphingobacteriales bacterium 50-39]